MGTSANTEAATQKITTPAAAAAAAPLQFEVTEKISSEWTILRQLLNKLSAKTGDFTLASGRKSDFFIDCKQTALTAHGHYLIGVLMCHAVRELFPNARAVAGVELGGCPLASAVSLHSFYSTIATAALKHVNGRTLEAAVLDPKPIDTGSLEGHPPLPALYVRKQAKDHGTMNLVEGGRQLEPGTHVVLLEDVITTGGSSVNAVARLHGAGYVVDGVVALVDRLEATADGQPLRQLGEAIDTRSGTIPVVSIYTRKTLLET